MRACICVYICVYIYMCIYVCIYMYINVCILYIYICMCIYMWGCGAPMVAFLSRPAENK